MGQRHRFAGSPGARRRRGLAQRHKGGDGEAHTKSRARNCRNQREQAVVSIYPYKKRVIPTERQRAEESRRLDGNRPNTSGCRSPISRGRSLVSSTGSLDFASFGSLTLHSLRCTRDDSLIWGYLPLSFVLFVGHSSLVAATPRCALVRGITCSTGNSEEPTLSAIIHSRRA